MRHKILNTKMLILKKRRMEIGEEAANLKREMRDKQRQEDGKK